MISTRIRNTIFSFNEALTLAITGSSNYVPIPDPDPDPTPNVLTDGITSIRFVVRNHSMCVDITLTPLGFGDGFIEDVDWTTIEYTF